MTKKILNILFLISICNSLFAQKSIDILPNNGRQGEHLAVSITGIKTNFSSASNTLQFYKQGSPTNAITVDKLEYQTPNSQIAHLFIQGSATVGAYTYNIYTPADGIVNSINPFYVNLDTGTAKILSVAPNNIEPDAYINILITGTNTHFTQGGNFLIAYFEKDNNPGMVYASKYKVIDDTHAIFTASTLPGGTMGSYDLRLESPIDGTLIFKNAITVSLGNMAKMVKVTPSIAHQNQKLTVSITGTRTKFTQGSPTIVFYNSATSTNDISVESIQIDNDSNFSLQIAISATCKRDLYDISFSNGIDFHRMKKSFEVTWPVGLSKISHAANDMKVYPNPTKGKITIETKEQNIEKVDVIDIQGRLVQTETPEKPHSEIQVSVSDFLLQNQYVLIRITTNKGVFYQKIVIQ
ncbi:MAG: hypothetical protein CFE21_09550 [Bacteroidetes bacterium B1(2017)]|nr:MAG: hypothetical protein CFE21_09550 [Bacteroidetes bacterium B1(2017)]